MLSGTHGYYQFWEKVKPLGENAIFVKIFDPHYNLICDGRHTPSLIWIFYRNQFWNPRGLGTIQSQIYSSFLKQLKFCKSVKKCAKYPTVHFFFGTGFSHFQRYFSTSSLSLNLKCFTLAEIAKLYLQTIPFGILILLPGAEKKYFESVSNVTGHPVCIFGC